MTKYNFTGEVPMIFANLSYGPDVQIVRASDKTPEEPEGATVTLYPGDVITVPDGYPEHAWLTEADSGKTLTVAQLRDELTARGVPFDPKAKKSDLEQLLTTTGETAATADTTSVSTPEEKK